MSRYATFQDYLKAQYKGPYNATDIIIRYTNESKTGIILIERKNFPHGIAIPGGIAENITFQENAIKEAKEETGLEIIIDQPYHRPFSVLSDPTQDPRAPIASICYTAQGYGTLQAGDDAKKAHLYTLDEVKNLLQHPKQWAFTHHQQIMRLYLEEQNHIKR